MQKMKNLTHYFSDSSKPTETSPAGSKEVSVKTPKIADMKSKKINSGDSGPKKRGRKKIKSASPDTDNSKNNKCNIGIEKSRPLANGKKYNLRKESVLETPSTKCPPKNINENSCTKSDLKETEFNEPVINEEKFTVGISKDEKSDEKDENVQNETLDEYLDINSLEQTSEKMETETLSLTQDDKKQKRKEKIKALAEKKGYAKRKLTEEQETKKMEKMLQDRKNAFTNVPDRDENQPEIVHKPPAYSLLNYFSKSTPEQRQKEEAAKCKISVKVEVHTPKEISPNSTPNTSPKFQCSVSSQSKQKRAEIKKALSEMDEIQFVSSENVSVATTPILQDKKKPNKPKWRIQFHSESFTDCGTDSEAFSPKSSSKMQKENRKSEVNDKEMTLIGKENSSRPEKSYAETSTKLKERSSKLKEKRNKNEQSDTDEESIGKLVPNKRRNSKSDAKKSTEIILDETKSDDQENSKDEVIIVEDCLPKRSAPEKIAPLFIKKRKLDPSVLEARRLFLQSDMSENENRPAKRKLSPPRIPSLPFPQVSHIAQLDSNSNSETSEMKIRLKSPSKYFPFLDLSAFTSITGVTNSVLKKCLTTFDLTKSNVDIEESLTELESQCEDVRTMWRSISQPAKAESPKESTKARTSKRRAATNKIEKSETKSVDDRDNVWICKYKPTTAQEIVGNELAAGKLKSWLERWKTPRKEDPDSDDDFYSSDCSSNYSSSDCNQVAVLLGPHGCGKTASVYAVAEELGYSVLEINASSRRTGKTISKEIEEATKSHRIKKSDMKQTFLKSKISEKKIPQNSLILIEDVDIIFEEDDGFVGATFQLATNTKRPIVMTCNESFSHLSKLAPQQLHIPFQMIAGNRASAFLKLISLAETGRKLSMSCVENLLKDGDLRKALLQLQFLLAAGETYVSSPIVDASHSFGMSLWRNTYQYLYKPAVKRSKKQKKSASQDSNTQAVDILSQLADDLERISLISKLSDTDDVSWNFKNSKSVMSISLSEDKRPYSYSDTISFEIAEFMTNEVIEKKQAKDSEQSIDQVSSKLMIRRTVNSGINSVLSQIASSTTDKRIISLDYLPSVRAICRAEETRNSSNNKRGNRFFHYLHGTKLPTHSTNILSAACKIMQEKPDK